MVSKNSKRMKYVYDNEISTSEEDSYEDTDYVPLNKSELAEEKPKHGKKPRCFSRNALLARKHRLKKKVYIKNLENDVTSLKSENKKLATVVDNQSFLIADLKKQLKYLKSVVANSSDISKLIRNIHQSTGMSVSSSLDTNLSLKNVCISKPKQPIPRKTAYPWDTTDPISRYPTPESNNYLSSPNDEFRGDDLNDILDEVCLNFPMDVCEEDLLNSPVFNESILDTKPVEVLSEHDYSRTISSLPVSSDGELEDVGVCLHVSKHRVSLEFCSTCSENAHQSWNH